MKSLNNFVDDELILAMTRKLVYSHIRQHNEGRDEDIYGLPLPSLHNQRINRAGDSNLSSSSARIRKDKSLTKKNFIRKPSNTCITTALHLNSFNMKSFIVLAVVVMVLVSLSSAQDEPPKDKCKKREQIPDCIPARKFCSDVKKGIEEEDDVCQANEAKECFCMTGSVWAEAGGQCIPDKLCRWMH